METNSAGTIAKPNNVGVNAHTQDINSGKNALIGGLNPADRNLISGNTAGSTGTAGYPGTGWVIQGNYVGVGADGLTPIANSTNGGSGALSIDSCNDVIVGGSQTGATNVIGESLGHGLAPDTVQNLQIEGNYIGLGYDGTTVLGNMTGGSTGSGIALSNSTNVTIKNNRVAGWKIDGIAVNSGNSNVIVDDNTVFNIQGTGIDVGPSTYINITNNTVNNNTDGGIITYQTIQADIYGNIVRNNGGTGISIINSTNTTIGSPGTANRNQIYNNSADGIQILGFGAPLAGTTIQNNDIHDNSRCGINAMADVDGVLIGGSSPGQGNIINNNHGCGVAVDQLTVTVASMVATPQNISVLGNSIYDNSDTPPFFSGLGIDLLALVDDSNPPDGSPESFTEAGPTPNDAGDTDTGPNNYMNYPVLASVAQQDNNVAINYSLDAKDSPTNQYRVEFFANDTADPSGYGEGQTYLGSTTTAPGTNLVANLTVPNGTNLNGKHITATTTSIDNTTASGFGSTSEFSRVTLASATFTIPPANNTNNTSSSNSSTNGSLSNTGQDNIYRLIASGLVITIGAFFVANKRHRHKKF